MKIMLHGATDCNSSNYGDFIYGEIIFQYLRQCGHEVCFYSPSNFFIKHISGYKDIKPFTKKDADLIVYIPGGYFGEGHNARFRDNLVQFFRFMPLGIWASYKKKPLIVLGVGAGPNHNLAMNFGIKRICNCAQFVTVRDNISYKALKHLCPHAPIIECGDLIITSTLRKKLSRQIEKIVDISKKKKILLIHYNHDKTALKKFAECAHKFVEVHPDFHVVVSSDSIIENEDIMFNTFNDIFKRECYHFKYKDPYEMTALLERVDVVLTCKLHVGVVAAKLGKSVVVAACHPEKTKRFYDQINESDRCLDLYKITDKELYKTLEHKYFDGIKIGREEIEKAKLTWKYLEHFLEEYNGKK